MIWKNIPNDINNFCSFVYKIEFDDGTFYIGCKKYWKLITSIDDSVLRISSNWKKYQSSSKIVKSKIKTYNGEITFSIIANHKTIFDSLCSERNIIIRYRKLYPEKILNITNGFTSTVDIELARRKAASRTKTGIKMKTETKQKISNKIKQYYITNPDKKIEKSVKMKKVMTDSVKSKISNSLKGKIFSDEHKIKLSNASSGKEKSIEHKKNLSIATKKQQKELYDKKPYIIEIEGVKYKSIREATINTGISFVTIKKRLNDENVKKYNWLN